MKNVILFCLVIIGTGVWLDKDRQTESFDPNFPTSELDQRRPVIEKQWLAAHPNAKHVRFAYSSSHGKIRGVFVNYYLKD